MSLSSQIAALVAGRCTTPFDVLGSHARDVVGEAGRVVRAFITWADSIEVIWGDRVCPMNRVHADGLFEVSFPEESEFFAYQLRVTDRAGRRTVLDDPYRFLPVLDEDLLGPFRTGAERRIHRLVGARVLTHQGVSGTCFAVWAPNAHNVNLMGEFNRWNARCHPMRPRGTTGVWELFLPGVGHGTHYKYDIRTRAPELSLAKADPFGQAMELRPRTASVVWQSDYVWGDGEWMRTRAARHAAASPLTVYEVHAGSWRRQPGADPGAGKPGWFNYRELAGELLPYVKEQGFTHVELLPLAEHPLDKSWGYQTVGYFAPTARHGTPDDFRFFVDRAHRLGLGVLMDWTPAHFPRDGHGLARFDGTHLYEHEDPRRGSHPDWGTLVFDYGRPEVAAFLISSAIYWLEELHVDGLRVDAVASMLYLDYSRKDGEWLPNRYGGRENLEAVSFLHRLNDAVHEECPGTVMIAEESTAWPKVSHPTAEGGLGFDLKWNMGWMHDTLEFMSADPIFRKGLYNKLTFSIWYAGSERFLLPLSHDEVVHLKASLLNKLPGKREQKLAHLRVLLAYMWAHPGRKLLFMGGEFGQPAEWNAEGELAWPLLDHPGHRGVQSLVRDLNRLYCSEPSLHELDLRPDGFEWLDCHDADRTTLSFIRWAREWTQPIIVAANFTPVSWRDYHLAVPFPGSYRLLLNTASTTYGAEPTSELPAKLLATKGKLHDRDQYLQLDFPPLAVLYWKWEGEDHNRG